MITNKKNYDHFSHFADEMLILISKKNQWVPLVRQQPTMVLDRSYGHWSLLITKFIKLFQNVVGLTSETKSKKKKNTLLLPMTTSKW